MVDAQRQALLKKKNELEEQAVQLENRDVLLEIARVTASELKQINRELSASA